MVLARRFKRGSDDRFLRGFQFANRGWPPLSFSYSTAYIVV
jgi:hypothetical protein